MEGARIRESRWPLQGGKGSQLPASTDHSPWLQGADHSDLKETVFLSRAFRKEYSRYQDGSFLSGLSTTYTLNLYPSHGGKRRGRGLPSIGHLPPVAVRNHLLKEILSVEVYEPRTEAGMVGKRFFTDSSGISSSWEHARPNVEALVSPQ